MSPSPQSVPPSDRGARSSTVQGAVPPRPSMTPAEMLEEIDRAAGPGRRLCDLRAELPAAHNRRPGGHRPAAVDHAAPIGAAARVPGPGAGAVAGAGPAVPAGQVLTLEQRQTVIDQALLMLEALYAHLPLKRALHAIDPHPAAAAAAAAPSRRSTNATSSRR